MEIYKEKSIYMRFHVTLDRAISFCRGLYGGAKAPGTNQSRFELAITTAGLTEDIQSQDYLDYHLTWLTGILCDAQDFNEKLFKEQAPYILSDLDDI
jgi:hypothetical protein